VEHRKKKENLYSAQKTVLLNCLEAQFFRSCFIFYCCHFISLFH